MVPSMFQIDMVHRPLLKEIAKNNPRYYFEALVTEL